MALDEGSYRFSGMWGAAYDGPNLIKDMIEVSAPLEIGRIAVPLVGTQDEGQKQGRNTREGTISIQKKDSAWELLVFNYSSRSLEQRRADRDAGKRFDPSFNLIVGYDDPEALGVEKWVLTGVRIWRLTLGFSLQDELVNREYPITWRHEQPLQTFKESSSNGQPVAQPINRVKLSNSPSENVFAGVPGF